jgi:hypothetical protein
MLVKNGGPILVKTDRAYPPIARYVLLATPTMAYTHVLDRGARGVHSPADWLIAGEGEVRR